MKNSLYKLEIICLKFIPYLITSLYIIGLVLNKFGIYCSILNVFTSMSILPLIFIWISSYTFKFCWKHRLPIYFITFITIINLIFSQHVTIWLYNVFFWISLLFGIITLTIGGISLLNKKHGT